jgi:hypothetical protein
MSSWHGQSLLQGAALSLHPHTHPMRDRKNRNRRDAASRDPPFALKKHLFLHGELIETKAPATPTFSIRLTARGTFYFLHLQTSHP